MSSVALPAYLATAEKRERFAEKLLLATQLMVESKTKHGTVIIGRFKLVTELKQRWDKAHFELARYYEDLYHNARAKEEQAIRQYSSGGSSQSPRAGSRGGALPAGDKDEPLSFSYVMNAVYQYNKCINYGSGYDLVVRALPRMMTLWLSFTSLSVSDVFPPVPDASHRSYLTTNANTLETYQRNVQGNVKKYASQNPASTWFQCLPQLVSRIGHPTYETRETIKLIISLVLRAYRTSPYGIWAVCCSPSYQMSVQLGLIS